MSKGKPKPKISDISRIAPTEEELKALQESLGTELHPVSAAILGAGLVEHELEVALRRRLKCSDDTWNELVSDIGPLRAFHSKITMAWALRMYSDDMRHNFHIVRNIRNQFAHSKKLVDFKNELIVKEMTKAKPVPGERKNFHHVTDNESGTQYGYISLCMLLVIALMRHGTKATQAQTRRIRRKVLKTSPWARSIWDQLLPPANALKLPPLSSLGRRNGDPMSVTPLGSPHALLHSSAKTAGKTDK
jgi:hypothetical protein